jgi:hypothetical protein
MPHISAVMPGPVPNKGNKEHIPVANDAIAIPLVFLQPLISPSI